MSPSLTPRPRNLHAFNTLGLACEARACVSIEQVEQLSALAALARREAPLLILGGGSNVVLPAELDGLVAQVALRGIRLLEATPQHWIVEAAAGERWHDLVAHMVGQGWYGLENLALIPGTVGAAPVQNIGAYGVELDQRLLSVDVYDLHADRLITLPARECGFGYRDSRFKHDTPGRWLITAVRFALPRPWTPVLDYPDLQRHPVLAASASVRAQDIFEAVCEIRRTKLPDPAVIGNAGSFFKNPVVSAPAHAALAAAHPGLVAYPQPDGRMKLAAGWLIDQCGWKGRDLGRAGVHARQALVLVNRGGATANDILQLARAIQSDVQARFGVALEPEPVVVPSGGPAG